MAKIKRDFLKIKQVKKAIGCTIRATMASKKSLLHKINFWFFLILILLFLPIKNSLAETNYSFTSTDSYYTTVAGYETYKIEYTPSSNITFKIGTYTSPVDTFINVFPKATANLSIDPTNDQTGGTSNDDNEDGFNAAFTQNAINCDTEAITPGYCSYVEKSLIAGTTYIIYIAELEEDYDLTTSATL